MSLDPYHSPSYGVPRLRKLSVGRVQYDYCRYVEWPALRNWYSVSRQLQNAHRHFAGNRCYSVPNNGKAAKAFFNRYYILLFLWWSSVSLLWRWQQKPSKLWQCYWLHFLTLMKALSSLSFSKKIRCGKNDLLSSAARCSIRTPTLKRWKEHYESKGNTATPHECSSSVPSFPGRQNKSGSEDF